MKKSGILQPELARVIASMGHTDLLVVADAGLPIPPGVTRIDLAVAPGLPELLPVLDAVARELQVERYHLADELVEGNPKLTRAIGKRLAKAERETVSHDELKALSARAVAVVRTGETTPYANVVLSSGVTF